MNTMTANGLEWIQISSTSKPLNIDPDNFHLTIDEYFKSRSFVVAYLDYNVLIGTWEKNTFHFYNGESFKNKYVQRLRLFDPNKELLIWRTASGFKCRLRADYVGGISTDVIVAKQFLFGTRKGDGSNGSFTEITEDRGTSLILPFVLLNFDNSGNLKSRIPIKTHNYVDYNDVGQAGYTDCRFVDFVIE